MHPLVRADVDRGPVEAVQTDTMTLSLADIVPAARKVVCLVADESSAAALRLWCEAHGFDLGASFGGEPRDPAQFLFHMTLIASENAVHLPNFDVAISPVVVPVWGFTVLGRDSDVPCLMIGDETGGLTAARDAAADAFGLTPTFADFKPHVSLSYAWTGTPALDDLPLPLPAITFDRCYMKDLT